MIRDIRFLSLVFAASLVAVSDAEAFLGDLLKNDEKKLSAEQLTNQESTAGTLLAKGRQQEASGKKRQARDTYKSIAKSYPRTEAAAEALYGYARLLEAEGEAKKAFEEYQELLTTYRNTPNFKEAVARQFAIAESLRDNDRKGFFGIGAAVQPSKLIEMFEQIAENAPYTEYAPKALINIGHVHTNQGENELAIASFQSVVDTYQGTTFASDAQYQIFKLRGVTAERSNSPVEDRAQVQAGLDFMNQNPNDQRSDEVESNLDAIEERSMEKLFTTGQFYEKSGKPDSARVYYREVVKNPNTPWAAKAQARLNAIDSVPQSVEKKAGLFGSNPLKKDKVEMRTSEDEVVPLPSNDPTE